MSRLSAKDPVGLRYMVEAEYPSIGKEKTLKVGYDGKKIRFLLEKDKEIYVNDPDSTGLFYSAFVHELFLEPFKSGGPIAKALAAKGVKFEGYALVNGVVCHALFAQHEDSTANSSVWIFLGTEDNLPRQMMTRRAFPGGPPMTEVVTFSELKINAPIADAAFRMETSAGFAVKKFTLPLKPQTPAPDWTLPDARGKKWSLAGFRGQVLVLDFWATWCAPCVMAMPKLQKLHEQFRGKGVKVIGISTWERGDPAKLMAEKKCDYQLLLKGEEIAEKYGVSALPTLFVIDAEGKIVHAELGYDPQGLDKLVRVVEKLIKNK
jgi:peroxiredoxin